MGGVSFVPLHLLSSRRASSFRSLSWWESPCSQQSSRTPLRKVLPHVKGLFWPFPTLPLVASSLSPLPLYFCPTLITDISGSEPHHCLTLYTDLEVGQHSRVGASRTGQRRPWRCVVKMRWTVEKEIYLKLLQTRRKTFTQTYRTFRFKISSRFLKKNVVYSLHDCIVPNLFPCRACVHTYRLVVRILDVFLVLVCKKFTSDVISSFLWL